MVVFLSSSPSLAPMSPSRRRSRVLNSIHRENVSCHLGKAIGEPETVPNECSLEVARGIGDKRNRARLGHVSPFANMSERWHSV
jgi:hypothetical protein